MQTQILHREPQQCHCAFSREQFLSSNLYDNQIGNCHCALSIHLRALFGDEEKVIQRTIIIHIFLIQPSNLKQPDYGDTAIDLMMMTVINGRNQVVIGFKSNDFDLFVDLAIISLTLIAEAGGNNMSIFPLNVISASVVILQVLFWNQKLSYS